MAKTPKNSGKSWSESNINQLHKEAGHNTPTRIIALHLGRSEASIRAKAQEINLSLKPTNQSPYGTKKK